MIIIERSYLKSNEKQTTSEHLAKLSFHELRAEAKKMNISTKGNREEIIKRIIEAPNPQPKQ